MSQENVEIVRASTEAFNKGDWDGALKDAARDFEMDLTRGVGPDSGVYRRDQVRELWSDFGGHWESWQVEPHEFIEVGEHVVVPCMARTTGRDGIELEARVTWTFTFREREVVRA